MSLRAQIIAGVVAGLIGGVLFQAVFFVADLRTGMPFAALDRRFAIIAETVLGPAALTNPASSLIGLGLHFCVAIAWALGYVYLVRTQPQLLSRPWISGAGFGIVVYVFMQIVLLTAGLYHRPMPDVLAVQLVAHIVFYGIPVALVVSRLLRPTPQAT